VSRHPHEIVLFDFDSYSIKFKSESEKLSRFASEVLKDPSKNILLLGRASLAGAAGIEYNRDLSLRRVVAVRKALLGKNVPQKRIRMLHLGNEEPQLNEWIAEMYGMKDIYRRWCIRRYPANSRTKGILPSHALPKS
jgi:outer membrane protein OmpA-like peptidoglycan-associated protein